MAWPHLRNFGKTSPLFWQCMHVLSAVSLCASQMNKILQMPWGRWNQRRPETHAEQELSSRVEVPHIVLVLEILPFVPRLQTIKHKVARTMCADIPKVSL